VSWRNERKQERFGKEMERKTRVWVFRFRREKGGRNRRKKERKRERIERSDVQHLL